MFVSISLGYYDAAAMKVSGYLTCLLFLVLLLTPVIAVFLLLRPLILRAI